MIKYAMAAFLATAIAAATASPLTDYEARVLAAQPGTPRVSGDIHQVSTGRLMVGFVEPDTAHETMASQGLLYVVLERHDGSIIEVARSAPFDYYTAGGRTQVEAIEMPSDTRFTVQFNHHGACTSGVEIYRFARIGSTWRVAGRDATQYACNPDDESMGDTRSEWSGNFLTGRIVTKEYRLNKLVSMKHARQVFPAFPISDFAPFDERHGPR